jgi:DNA-binding IclR family transcriptional regulator
MRGAWIATLEPMAKDIVTANPLILRFYTASAGMLMLMKLVQMQGADPDRPVTIEYSDLARRLGVSRTHVRSFLKTVAADGAIELDIGGSLRLAPTLMAALDRNIAGRMSLLDRAHGAAVATLART